MQDYKLDPDEISDELLTIASDWWFDKFIDSNQYKDNGAHDKCSIMSGTLGKMTADSHPVNESQRALWRTAVKDQKCRLQKARKDPDPYYYGKLSFHVDYHPCKKLRDCLKFAGIDESRVPIKTSMRICRDPRGSGLWASTGYGQPFEYICDLAGNAPTTRALVNYTVTSPEWTGQNGTKWPIDIYTREEIFYDPKGLADFLARDDWDTSSDQPYSSDSFKKFVSQTNQICVDGKWTP